MLLAIGNLILVNDQDSNPREMKDLVIRNAESPSLSVYSRLRRFFRSSGRKIRKRVIKLGRRLNAPSAIRLWNRLALIQSYPFRYALFDVYDTVITRLVTDPHSLFLLLGNQVSRQHLLALSPDKFLHARVEAERRAHVRDGDIVYDVTLENIYSVLDEELRIGPERASQIRQLELQLEKSLTRPVPATVRLLRELRHGGKKIVFVSDMYLSSAFLADLLDQFQIKRSNEPIYVSGEEGCQKRTGDLFRIVLRNEGSRRGEAICFGDNGDADILGALKCGLRARLTMHAQTNKYERLLEAHSLETGGLSSLMAGASRIARMTCQTHSLRDQALVEIAAGVIAPRLTAYVLWLLKRANERGLDRLYFLSRDGQILIDIARRLAQKLSLKMEFKYLYSGRTAWNLGSVSDASDPIQTRWVWVPSEALTITTLFERAGLIPDDLAGTLIEMGFGRSDWTRVLTKEESARLRSELRKDVLFQKKLTDACKMRRELLMRYIERESLPQEARWATVDTGWDGTAQNTLASILREMGHDKTLAYYFGVMVYTSVDGSQHDPYAAAENDVREPYFFDERDGSGFIDPPPDNFINYFLESFCVGDQGADTGFEIVDGTIHPTLASDDNHEVLDWGLHHVRRTVAEFVDNLFLDPDVVDSTVDLRPAIVDVISELYYRPSRLEAEAFGSYPYETGATDGTGSRLASPFKLRDVPRVSLRRTGYKMNVIRWYEGSLRLTPQPLRGIISALARLRDFFRRIGFIEALSGIGVVHN